MSSPSIGHLDQRLVLQAPSRVADAAGGWDVSWSDVAEVWAAVRPASGGEGLDAEALRAEAGHAVWLRYRGDVRPDMRFQWGTRVLDIVSVADGGGRALYLKCLCRERVT